MEKNYTIICRTDLYHASREDGFNKFTGVKEIDSFANIKDANNALFSIFKEITRRYFHNWGLACIYATRPNDESITSASTVNGRRYFEHDIYRYEVSEK